MSKIQKVIDLVRRSDSGTASAAGNNRATTSTNVKIESRPESFNHDNAPLKEQIERVGDVLETKLLPIIDIKRLSGGLLDPDIRRKCRTQEYRGILSAIMSDGGLGGSQKTQRHSGLKFVQITSSIGGEGKSFLSLNIAVALAELQSNQVMLIDADPTKSTLTIYLGTERSPGITELLNDTTSNFGSAVFELEDTGVLFIPHGQLQLTLQKNNLKDAVSNLMSAVGASGDAFVIIDSPPILNSEMAIDISDIVDHVIFVVESLTTPTRTVLKALRRTARQCHLDIVLNKCMTS
jgi:hypothetical protein